MLAFRRKIRTHREWNVEISGVGPFRRFSLPRSRAMARSFISRAALLVNVTARMRSGDISLDQVGDAIGDDARLARAGTGQDQQWTAQHGNGCALRGVEVVESHRGEPALGDDTGSVKGTL
jgi:hypothetical protein